MLEIDRFHQFFQNKYEKKYIELGIFIAANYLCHVV